MNLRIKDIFLFCDKRGNGRIITISISKIRKITEIKKNFKENEMRDSEKGSNPHSKGDNFSLSSDLFINKIREIIIIIKGIQIIVIIFIV